MKAGFVEARRWRAPREGGGQRPRWGCPDAPAVRRAGWEDREVWGQKGKGREALGPQEEARKSQHRFAAAQNQKSSVCIHPPRLVQPFLFKKPFRTASVSASWGPP